MFLWFLLFDIFPTIQAWDLVVCIRFGFFFHNCLEVQKFFSLTLADEGQQLPEHVDPSPPAVHSPQVHRQVHVQVVPVIMSLL